MLFNIDIERAPVAAFVMYDVASHLLVELVKLRGQGAWLEELREQYKTGVKNMNAAGVAMTDEVADIEAGLKMVDAVFDRIGFTDD